MNIRTSTSLVALVAALATGAASAQEAANISSTKLLLGFSQLLNSDEGKAALDANLATAIAINNGSNADQRQQAIHDNTIAALVGSFSNGQLVADALGQKLSGAFDATNQLNQNFTSTTFSATFADLFTQVNMLVQSDSAFAKNFYANGSVNGNPANPAVGISLPPGGQFNVYDKAFSPDPTNANTVGNSRPGQVAPDQIQTFTGQDYFGNTVDSATILPTLKTNAAFPSGHSAFGFASTTLFAILVPERFQEFLTRGSEYAESRVVLGAHYPLDTIGARIMTLQTIARMMNNDPEYTNRAYTTALGQHKTSTGDFAALIGAAGTDLRNMLENGCGDTVATCIADSADDRFSDKAANEANYLYRLTFGLPPVGDTTLAPVVPEGAEVLLSTRFSYLTADQRREVLATTEIPSGYALDDGSGWARLNLFKAGNGYGAFRSDVDVTMNAADGGFAMSDVWSNNISGEGGLTKRGDGKLELAGLNTYAGDTKVEGGELAVTGRVAGNVVLAQPAVLSGNGTILGDLTVDGLLAPGTTLDPTAAMIIGGDLVFTPLSTLAMDMGGAKPGIFDQLIVGGDLWLNDAMLDLSFLKGLSAPVGSFLTLIDLTGDRMGLFAGLGENALVGTYRGSNYFLSYAGGDGNDIGLSVAPVPLPASLGLLFGGLGVLAALRRKRSV